MRRPNRQPNRDMPLGPRRRSAVGFRPARDVLPGRKKRRAPGNAFASVDFKGLRRTRRFWRMAASGAHLPLLRQWMNAGDCRKCMDRLPFASEVVHPEVADMYPAC